MTHKITIGQPSVEGAKKYRIKLIKKEAGERISALDWKVTRAKERGDQVALQAAYDEREAIRQASDQAEAQVMAMTDYDQIMRFTW